METPGMEDISALHSAIQRPLDTNATHKQSGAGQDRDDLQPSWLAGAA